MSSEQIETLKGLYAKFKADLESFARKHQKEISKNPMLRAHFQKMCTTIGVDPLACNLPLKKAILFELDWVYD